MLEIGKRQTLQIMRITPHGAYLGECAETKTGQMRASQPADTVLLPGKELPEGAGVGSELDVFLYKDSEDRLIATAREPKIKLGELAVLEVKSVTSIGAFLDWGLEKDL